MLHLGSSQTKARERAHQVLEQTLEVAKTRGHAEGGRGAVLISLLALVLSGVSLYETTLKQAAAARVPFARPRYRYGYYGYRPGFRFYYGPRYGRHWHYRRW
jgi:hypothetical protein